MKVSLVHRTIFVLLYCIPALLIGQSSAKSKAFRSKPADIRMYEIRPSDVTYQLWEGFQLMRNASSGDAPSQHELSLRYLTGNGFTADTAKAALWMKRAADQDYILAMFNYGIYLNNGWGMEWDPFEAFRYFRTTAEKRMREGEYVLGVFYTDNLVVPRDYAKAYDLVKRSADQGYPPAKELLVELDNRGITGTVPTTASKDSGKSPATMPVRSMNTTTASTLQPVLLEFDEDTAKQADDMTLLRELFNEGSEELRGVLGISKILNDSLQTDSTGLSLILRAADVGNPEAMTIVARCFERGTGVPKDNLSAAVHYIRAIRMDSRRAPALLWRLINQKNVLQNFQQQAMKKQTSAQYVIASLSALNLSGALTDEQALQFLQLAAAKNFIPAILDLGNCYSMGQWVKQDKRKAVEFWKQAAALGSVEGKVRVAVSDVFDGTVTDARRSFEQLLLYSEQGSVLAQTALGYCYEKGIIVPIHLTKAISYYRRSAQRGNQSAMSALIHLYDDRRPRAKEFQITDH